MPERSAYVDESFQEHPRLGFYVLAAAVFDHEVEAARAAMLELRGTRRIPKLHWTEMDGDDRARAAATVAQLAGLHVVTVGAPVEPRKQERARHISLRRLVFELHDRGVATIWMEARQSTLDRADIELVQQTRFDLPKGSRLRVEHAPGASEPLFWVADIVAGAVRAQRQGQPGYQATLGDTVQVIEVEL
jgi:hypothetical protein